MLLPRLTLFFCCPPFVKQVAELGAEVAALSSERAQLEREADQMQRNMTEMAHQLQVKEEEVRAQLKAGTPRGEGEQGKVVPACAAAWCCVASLPDCLLQARSCGCGCCTCSFSRSCRQRGCPVWQFPA